MLSRRFHSGLPLLALLIASACAHGWNEARPPSVSVPVSAPISVSSDASPASRAPASAANELSPDELRRLIEARRGRVEEFAFLREWAAQRRLRVWAAGGSAAGFAYYAKQHAEHERLLARGQPSPYFDSKFKYGYYQIFRSTQDADIVLDATEAEAVELEQALRERFPYLQGSKSTWEVRLLRHPRGEGAGLKEPLIDNPNFLDQNSDSHSTGMIELTDPPRGESAVRDLFDWKNQKDPAFLRDVAEGKLRFYRNPRHWTTSRAKEGLNPEILSVIRALTKSFQYGPEIRAEGLTEMRDIIAAFDPVDPTLAPAKGQIENNAKKLYSHAENLERAYLTLEELGLRGKLLRFGGVAAGVPSPMAMLLSRIPLIDRPFGRSGRTAGEIFGAKEPIVVAHETKDLLAYESITRSRRGLPNVLTSRQGAEGSVSGETAVYGDGFYTKRGREGARSTGFTIRFTLDPRAREGVDFAFVPKSNYVVIKNRRAIRVVDESVEMAPMEFFRFVRDAKFDRADRGLWRMLGLMMRPELARLSRSERREIAGWALAAVKRFEFPTWVADFVLPVDSLRGELVAALKGALDTDFRKLGAEQWDALFGWSNGVWVDLFREAGVLEKGRGLIDPMLRAALDSKRSRFRGSVLIPDPDRGTYRHIHSVLERAEAIEGRERLIARLESLPKVDRMRLLSAILSGGPSRWENDPGMALLREAGIVDEGKPLIDTALRRILAGEFSDDLPLLWRWWATPGSGSVMDDWARMAMTLEGADKFRVRVEAWSFAKLERVLFSSTETGGSPARDILVARLIRHPKRPANYLRRWDAAKVAFEHLDIRLHMGPVSGKVTDIFPRFPKGDDYAVIRRTLGRISDHNSDRATLVNAVEFAKGLLALPIDDDQAKSYSNFVLSRSSALESGAGCPELLKRAAR